MEKIEFETFRNLKDSYTVNQLRGGEPSCVNFLQYRKFKVSIELIEEPRDVLIERLEKLLKESVGYNKREMIRKELERIKNQ